MKYIEKYLEECIKVKPLGEVTTRDDTLYDMTGESVYIDGQDVGIFVSDADYAVWLEKKLEGRI